MPCSVWNGAFSYSKAEMVTVYIYYCFLRQLSQRKHPPSSQLSSPLIFLQKHYVHNITVVHVDGGEGGVRAPALGQCRRQPGALKNHSPDGFSPPHAPAAPFSSLLLLCNTKKRPLMRSLFRGREGGIRTLAPVTPAYSLSRGAGGG